MHIVLLFVISFVVGCSSAPKTKKLVYDVCVYFRTKPMHCFPVNQSHRSEYEREISPGHDIVMKYEDYINLKTHNKLLQIRK